MQVFSEGDIMMIYVEDPSTLGLVKEENKLEEREESEENEREGRFIFFYLQVFAAVAAAQLEVIETHSIMLKDVHVKKTVV